MSTDTPLLPAEAAQPFMELARVLSEYDAIVNGRLDSRDAEADFVNKDGSRIPYYFTGLRVTMGGKTYLSGVGIDVADRRRAEEALRFTQFAVDHAGDAAYWLDPEGRFVYANETACKSLGYYHEELFSMTVYDIAPELSKEAWFAQWELLRQRH